VREGEGRTDGERERASKERERAKDGERSEERGASRRSRGGGGDAGTPFRSSSLRQSLVA
jgi:hypothetical protein